MDSSNRRSSIQERARTQGGEYLANDMGYALSPVIDPEISPVQWFESPYPKINHSWFSDYK